MDDYLVFIKDSKNLNIFKDCDTLDKFIKMVDDILSKHTTDSRILEDDEIAPTDSIVLEIPKEKE